MTEQRPLKDIKTFHFRSKNDGHAELKQNKYFRMWYTKM